MSRWSQLSERNQAAMERNAESMLSDTRHDYLRSTGALRVVSLAYVAVTAAMAALWMYAPQLGAVGLIAWVIAVIALRLAVRSQADLADDVLDERMRVERNQAYLNAYRFVALIMIFPIAVAVFVIAAGEKDAVISLGYSPINALFWSAMSMVIGAPSVALAMQQSQRGRRP